MCNLSVDTDEWHRIHRTHTQTASLSKLSLSNGFTRCMALVSVFMFTFAETFRWNGTQEI